MFYLRGIIERVGRGTLKILEECKALGLRSPQWKESATGITLIFFGRAQQPRLNHRQKDVLQQLGSGDVLRPADYYAQMQAVVSQRQAQRDLSELAAGGWLQQEGEGPSTVYVRTDKVFR